MVVSEGFVYNSKKYTIIFDTKRNLKKIQLVDKGLLEDITIVKSKWYGNSQIVNSRLANLSSNTFLLPYVKTTQTTGLLLVSNPVFVYSYSFNTHK